MLRTIDGKSLLIGGLLVAVAVCAMGALPLLHGEYNGRFTLVAGTGNEYVLDTATGQVWAYLSNTQVFYAPKIEGYAPEEEPMQYPDPNRPQP